MSNDLGWGTGITVDPPLVVLLALAPLLVVASCAATLVPALSAARAGISESLRAE